MRKGGGKAKGGAYENTIARKIAAAFKSLGIHEDDCYRTKNSGATKKQPGDLQFSPHFAKMFPVLVECKHYKNVKYKLGKAISDLPKSFALKEWWKQVIREQSAIKHKKALLIFRPNNCPDIVCLTVEHLTDLCGDHAKWQVFSWSMFTMWKNHSLIMVPLDEFLPCCVDKLKKRKQSRGKYADNK